MYHFDIFSLTRNQIEITREIGNENIFLFGNLSEDVEDLRHAHKYGSGFEMDSGLSGVFDAIQNGTFGEPHDYNALVDSVVHGDYYLVSDDFSSYCKTQDLIDEAYKDFEEWTSKCILSVSRMGFFSSDRCIVSYAELLPL